MAVRCGTIGVEDVVRVARGEEVVIDDFLVENVRKAREHLMNILGENRAVYGINTGVGELVKTVLSKEEIKMLQKNIVRSHSCGVGKPLRPEFVRAAMFIRLNTLLKGFSGVSPELVLLIKEFLNKNIVPVVPEKGSVGASGDLAPLAHIALALIGEGKVLYRGEVKDSREVMDELGLRPLELSEKEGLALINGTSLMSGIGCVASHLCENLIRNSLVAAMMSFEALRGNPQAFDHIISSLRPHRFQVTVSRYLRLLLEGYSKNPSHVQDPYTLRCIPQVYSSVLHSLENLKEILEIEINSVTDNPIIVDDKVLSGGNFHGQILANAMDYLAVTLTSVGNMIERRIYRLLDHKISGLPPFLSKKPGVNSGLMLLQYTAAALCNENKVLAYPSSADSIPTSAGQEDHVSMGMTSALKLLDIIDNMFYLVAIEYFTAAQALEFERPTSRRIIAAYQKIREICSAVEDDRVMSTDIENIKQHIIEGSVLNAVWDFE